MRALRSFVEHHQASSAPHHIINRCLFIIERSNDFLSGWLCIDCLSVVYDLLFRLDPIQANHELLIDSVLVEYDAKITRTPNLRQTPALSLSTNTKYTLLNILLLSFDMLWKKRVMFNSYMIDHTWRWNLVRLSSDKSMNTVIFYLMTQQRECVCQ